MLVAAMMIGGCKGGESAKLPRCEQVIDLDVRADSDLNPNADGKPLPVEMRVYQLKDRARFDRADFYAMWQEDAQALDADLLDKTQFTVFPDSSEGRRYWRKADAAYLGVVAIFRRPLENQWHHVFPLLAVDDVRKRCDDDSPQQTVRMTERVIVRASSVVVSQ